jgi:hypothetical protein
MVKAETRNVENDPGIPVKSSLTPRVSRAGDFETLGGVSYEKPQKVRHGDIVVKITAVCVKPYNGQTTKQQ